MNSYVTDAHALFWYLVNSSKLGAAASHAFDEGARGTAEIGIPAIVFAEFYFLNIKLGKPLDFADVFRRIDSGQQYVLLPRLPADVLDFDQDAAVTEMHDRMIVGAARRRGASLITADRQITQRAAVPIVW